MKDVLEYTESELSQLSTEDLQLLLREAEMKESLYNTSQLVQKVLINSLYGALANKWFPLFNEDMAAAITGNGRYFIRKLANYIEETLQKMYKRKNPYVIYGDTDSCVGSTLIRTSQGLLKIEDLYHILAGEIEIRGKNNFIKHINKNITTPSVSKDLKLENKTIKYIMKHKVKKRMFKIKHNNDEVIVTEDHSVMTLRENKLIAVSAKDLKKGDKIIKL